MKIGQVSDLHESHWEAREESAINQITPGMCDVLVVAGDLTQVTTSPFLLAGLFRALKEKAEHVVYVSGNHEYYEGPFEVIHDLLESAASSAGVHFLYGKDGQVTIDGVHFIGGTLWYDMKDPVVLECHKNFSDRCIRGIQTFGQRMREEELENLRKNATSESVVVSHFAPTYRSVGKDYIGSKFNCLYVSQGLDAIIRENKPRLWLHGHTHTAFDYVEGNTRVVCKPYGYPFEVAKRRPRPMPFVINFPPQKEP